MKNKILIIFVFLLVVIIVLWSGCIQMDTTEEEDTCESSDDCVLAYTGTDACAPCDVKSLKSPEFECVSKETAAKIDEQRAQKRGYVECKPCPPNNLLKKISCECVRGGRCQKPRFIALTEEESREIARQFIVDSPTYKSDGFELKYIETTMVKCPYCWNFIFEFSSKHAGYGDRTGEILAEVITPHTASITVQEGEVTSAILDDKWDMLEQKLVKEEKEEKKEKKPSSSCSLDIDCAQEESKCADGIDPYHKCLNGECVELTFIRDPCLDHICPKGNWHIQTDKTCLHYENCAKSGCDDGSDKTIDTCVGIGTRSEGCLYTIVKDKYLCTTDSDCVPEQCCHPTSCVNKVFAPNCEGILCTMVCEGPIDCGAGSCACIENKCTVVAMPGTI